MAFGIKKLLKKITPSETTKTKKSSEDKAITTDKKEPKSKSVSKLKVIVTETKSNKSKSSKKEEKIMTTQTDSSAPGSLVHEFVEVAADLLAKPSALCDLVEAQGGKSVLVFCNNPSDTDFVEVILKKRGISAVKLIGFVAPEKLEKTQERVKSSDLAAVVVTDVAARGLDFSLFSVVVNYSLPADSETYNIRAAVSQPGDRTVVSIVSPLDFANFHQLKTSTNFEFVKREPPSKEDLAKAKLSKVKVSAQAKSAALDPSLSELAKQISKDSDSNGIIAYLLQNLFDVVPQLQSQIDKLCWERDNRDHEEDDMGQEGQGQQMRAGRDRDSRGGFDSRDGRGQRGGRDRDRGQGGRGGDRDRRDRNDGGRGRPQTRHDSDGDDRGFEGRDDNRRFDNREDRDGDEGSGRRSREDRRPPPPQKIRDDRLYIGRGEKDGLSESDFASLLKEHCGIEKEQLKRFFLRKNYAFADLPEGIGADVVQKLNGVDSKAGSLYVAKATQVITVIENENSGDNSENSESEQSFEGEDQAVV